MQNVAKKTKRDRGERTLYNGMIEEYGLPEVEDTLSVPKNIQPNDSDNSSKYDVISNLDT
jgi:hypothetical protein